MNDTVIAPIGLRVLGNGEVVVGPTAVNKQTGTSYTIVPADGGKLVTFSNASPIAVQIAPATAVGMGYGWWVDLHNRGPGLLTLSVFPASSTIDGAASLVLTAGQGVRLYSDDVNYYTQSGRGGANFLNGNGPPAASLGYTGYFYYDNASGLLYGPKDPTGWGGGLPLGSAVSSMYGFANLDGGGAVPMTQLPITGDQGRLALLANSTAGIKWLTVVLRAISPDEEDPDNIAWNAPFWHLSSRVWGTIQIALAAQFGSFTSAQLAALQAQAASYRQAGMFGAGQLTISRRQLWAALENQSVFNTVATGLTAGSANWVEFNSAARIALGDNLWVEIQSLLSYSSAQMTALWALCQTFAE
jgi:hypothetical protein